MSVWRYKAVDQSGQLQQGCLFAFNATDLAERLQRQGLDLVAHRRLRNRIWRRRYSRRDLVGFCLHMEYNLQAGIPVLTALQDLANSAEVPRWRSAIGTLVHVINEGKTLSEAMQSLSVHFPPIIVQLVQAGEHSGDLSFVFRELAKSLRWQDEQMTQLRNLLLYPIIVAIVICAVGIFLLTQVVPELAFFLQSMNQTLPFYTQWLLRISTLFTEHWQWLLLMLVLFCGSIIIAFRVSSTVRWYGYCLLLRLPLIGTLWLKAMLARVSLFFSMLYAAGVTIVDCLANVRGIGGNPLIARQLENIQEQVVAGQSLHTALRTQEMFPPLFVRMVQVGETTGTLEQTMRQINYFYSRDVREALDRLQVLVEPILTVFLGALLALLLFSILSPVYELVSTLPI